MALSRPDASLFNFSKAVNSGNMECRCFNPSSGMTLLRVESQIGLTVIVLFFNFGGIPVATSDSSKAIHDLMSTWHGYRLRIILDPAIRHESLRIDNTKGVCRAIL